MITFTTIATATATVVATIVTVVTVRRSPDRTRSHLKSETEILANLPAASPAHAQLLTHIEEQVRLLTQRRRVGRDWKAIISMTTALGVMGWATIVSPRQHGFPAVAWDGLIVLAVVAWVFVMVESIPTAERDAHGRRVGGRRVTGSGQRAHQ